MSRRIVVVLLSALFCSPVRAGLLVVLQENDGRSQMFVEGKKLRLEKAGSPGRIVIFDGEANKYFQLDPSAKTYSEMTRADGAAIAARVREALARLSPEERERAEALLGKPVKNRHEEKYQPTGEQQTIAGYACQVYRKLRDGVVIEEGCYILWNSNTVTKEDLTGLFLLGQFMDQMLTGTAGTKGGVTDRLYGEWERAPGFPATLTRFMENGLRGKEQRLISLKRDNIAPEQFTVPRGYSLVKMNLSE